MNEANRMAAICRVCFSRLNNPEINPWNIFIEKKSDDVFDDHVIVRNE